MVGNEADAGDTPGAWSVRMRSARVASRMLRFARGGRSREHGVL